MFMAIGANIAGTDQHIAIWDIDVWLAGGIGFNPSMRIGYTNNAQGAWRLDHRGQLSTQAHLFFVFAHFSAGGCLIRLPMRLTLKKYSATCPYGTNATSKSRSFPAA